jgi:hypothetical protein
MPNTLVNGEVMVASAIKPDATTHTLASFEMGSIIVIF